MTIYLYTNLLGCFLFDEKGKLLDKTLFKKDFLDMFLKIRNGDWINEEGNLIEKFRSKKAQLVKVINRKNEYFHDSEPALMDDPVIVLILSYFAKNEFFDEFRKRNTELTRYDMKNIKSNDFLIIQAVNNIEELEHSTNTLSKRLREWYELYFPEISKKINDHKRFAETIIDKSRDELMKAENIKDSMGVSLSQNDLKPIFDLAKGVLELFELKEKHLSYLDDSLETYCPNLKAIAGTSIAAKLIALSGSLERLSIFPSSTIQTLGAEKAMFRHLKTGQKPPKYGIILMHPIVASGKKDKGKIARMLANKISLASKVDYFRGDEYKGYELRENLEKEVKKLLR
ncbi:MAG: NOP5/NOP56 family protein [Candidatus Woesearchaeota archaeon]